eukprot:8143683-Pyramimonas_sp.AAC.1
MSWRSRAPWHQGRGGRKRVYGGAWGRDAQRRDTYSVCGACGHWEFDKYGNWSCSKCGGRYLDSGEPVAQDAGGRDAAGDLEWLAA